MKGKARRVDYYPDEYVTGVGGVLNASEQGVYWMICSLIMSEAGPIAYNERRIAGLCLLRPSDVRRVVEKLISTGKIARQSDGKLCQKRAQSEVEKSLNRIQSASENGSNGGRPKQKPQQNQSNVEAGGSFPEKLTTNLQPPTTNLKGKEEPNGSSKKRGSRLSEEWTLPDDWRAWALTEGLDATAIERECGKFRNYWISVPGAKGCKISWYATWQNWIWKAIEDRSPKSRPGIDPDADIYRGVMYSQ